MSPLFMGRAAAVRAATKGKTDAKKAKVNAYYGKKIIMAVKQGGSPDPVANRQLAELIKAAKNNSVPMDVSCDRSIAGEGSLKGCTRPRRQLTSRSLKPLRLRNAICRVEHQSSH